MAYRAAGSEDRPHGLTGKRVLYAEDDLLNRRLFTMLLGRLGLQCRCVGDGQTALSLFSRERYDAVVLDRYLPRLNGEDVAREIRRIEPKVPIIALTSDLEAAEGLLLAGFNRVFCKPLRGRECLDYLLSTIGAVR